MSVAEVLGYLASLLVFATFGMKTMIPLRLVAICSNIAFIAYGFTEQLYPVLVLHIALLPLNVFRLLQIRRLIREVEHAATHDLDFKVFLPHMTRSFLDEGEILFTKGDHADAVYYIANGRICLKEIDATLENGDVVGEIAVFSPQRKRMATAVCETQCEIYFLTDAKMQELYYQNPAFGFTLLRLITGRLLEDMERLSGERFV